MSPPAYAGKKEIKEQLSAPDLLGPSTIPGDTPPLTFQHAHMRLGSLSADARLILPNHYLRYCKILLPKHILNLALIVYPEHLQVERNLCKETTAFLSYGTKCIGLYQLIIHNRSVCQLEHHHSHQYSEFHSDHHR